MMNVNLHIYPTPFQFESRILRETESLIYLGLVDQIIIVSSWKFGLNEEENIDSNISVRRIKSIFSNRALIPFNKLVLYFEFYFHVIKLFKSSKINIINCHSLFVLPIGVILKLFNPSIKLIYDAHELETHKTGLSQFMIAVSIILERILVIFVDRIIVVSPSIANFYKRKYRKEVYTLRNIPVHNYSLTRTFIFNDKFNIPRKDLIFIYQGVLNNGRGVELLIEVFKNVPSDKHLILMGYGPMKDVIVQNIKNYKNIHFLPAVKPADILDYTCGADVGLAIIENISLSYFYCLPNKFFEYLHSGIPVISSNFPDMLELTNMYKCGWSVNVNMVEILSLINKIDHIEINDKKNGVSKIKEDLNWESESLILKEIYRK
jgi:glycosyltransferase involved in cell wall biosynthesis